MALQKVKNRGKDDLLKKMREQDLPEEAIVVSFENPTSASQHELINTCLSKIKEINSKRTTG